MNERTTKIAGGAAAIAAIVLAVALRPWATPQPEAPSTLYGGEVIATAGTEEIHLERLRAVAEGLGVHSLDDLGEDWPALLVRTVADETIFRTEAASRDVTISPPELSLRVTQALGGVPASDYKSQYGETLDQLQYKVYMNLLTARLFETVTKDAKVTADEVRAYFEKTRDTYSEPDDEVAWLQNKEAIEQDLLYERQKKIWYAWLSEQEASPRYVIKVVADEGWWEALEAKGAPNQEEQG